MLTSFSNIYSKYEIEKQKRIKSTKFLEITKCAKRYQKCIVIFIYKNLYNIFQLKKEDNKVPNVQKIPQMQKSTKNIKKNQI